MRWGRRDGFQIEPDFIPTEQKVEVVNLLVGRRGPPDRGDLLRPPEGRPPAAGRRAGHGAHRAPPGTRYAALVPNDKGAVRAVDAGVDAIHTVVSASESHNLANVNMTIAESMDKLRAVMQVAERAKVPVACGVSTSFGCPFEGDVPLAQLESVVRRLIDMGARAIGLADTTGMANPSGRSRPRALMPKFPGIDWTLHTHDTRAMAIPNILAALELGVANLDCSIGGLGGCPFAPGASGNVCSEDLVHCLTRWASRRDRPRPADRGVAASPGHRRPPSRPDRQGGKSTRRYPVPDTVAGRVSAARA